MMQDQASLLRGLGLPERYVPRAAALAEKVVSVEQLPAYDELTELYGLLQNNEEHNLWGSLCTHNCIHHAFSEEYVSLLAHELLRTGIEGRVVEICAGNGKLSHWLRLFGVKSVATDKCCRTNIDYDPRYVERIDAVSALERYRPQLVIGCWLPPKSDLASRAIDFPSVTHFLLIGEDDTGCTGGAELYDRQDLHYDPLESVDKFTFSRTQPVEMTRARMFTNRRASLRLQLQDGVAMTQE
jgi:hypothetical protein